MAFFDVNDLKIIIKSIVISSPKPISTSDLQRDFKASEGMEIPFHQMGFRNIWDFLASLNDIIEVLPDQTLRAVRTSETKHLQDLIQKQRKPKKRSNSSRSGVSRPHYGPTVKTRVSSYSNFQYNQQKASYSRNQSGAWSRNINTAHRNNVPQPQPDRAMTRNPMANHDINQYCFDSSSEYSDGSFELVSPPRKNSPVHEPGPSSSNNYRRPPERSSGSNYGNPPERSSGNYNGNPPERSSGNYNGNPPERSSGNYNGNQPVRPCGSSTRSERNGNAVAVSPWGTTSDTVFACEKNDMAATIPDGLKARLREIVKEHPSGVLCSELPQLHMDQFGQTVDSRDYGFPSMIELVDAISDLSKFEDKKSRDWIIYDDARVSPALIAEERAKACERIRNATEIQESPVDVAKLNELYEDSPRVEDRRGYPDGILHLGGKVARLGRLSDVIVPVMEVKLAEIYTPQNFYVTSCHALDSHNILMEKIQSFYADSADLSLSNFNVKAGLYCVAPYMGKWHRAIITNVLNLFVARVFLIDFGTHLSVSKTKLRFLHTQFSLDPSQAIKAKLHNIVPLNNAEKFSKEANVMFFELAADKKLRAYVKGINFLKGQTVSVRLVDPNQDEENFIDEKLVDAGLAEFGSKSILRNNTDCSPRADGLEKKADDETKLQTEEKRQSPPEVPSPGALLRNMLTKVRSLS